MDSILLIGSVEATFKRLKSHLIRGGFQVVLLEPGELNRLDEMKQPFRLGILDATQEGRVSALVERLRSQSAVKELPLVVLLKESHLKEISLIPGLEDFLLAQRYAFDASQ